MQQQQPPEAPLASSRIAGQRGVGGGGGGGGRLARLPLQPVELCAMAPSSLQLPRTFKLAPALPLQAQQRALVDRRPGGGSSSSGGRLLGSHFWGSGAAAGSNQALPRQQRAGQVWILCSLQVGGARSRGQGLGELQSKGHDGYCRVAFSTACLLAAGCSLHSTQPLLCTSSHRSSPPPCSPRSLIFLSELGDKTFFIAALLAMRCGKWISFVGSTAALAAMTVSLAACRCRVAVLLFVCCQQLPLSTVATGNMPTRT